MQRMTLEAFWDAANVALSHRKQSNMLFGEARATYASYIEDWKARNMPDVADIMLD